jgi:hypothetical protein
VSNGIFFKCNETETNAPINGSQPTKDCQSPVDKLFDRLAGSANPGTVEEFRRQKAEWLMQNVPERGRWRPAEYAEYAEYAEFAGTPNECFWCGRWNYGHNPILPYRTHTVEGDRFIHMHQGCSPFWFGYRNIKATQALEKAGMKVPAALQCSRRKGQEYAIRPVEPLLCQVGAIEDFVTCEHSNLTLDEVATMRARFQRASEVLKKEEDLKKEQKQRLREQIETLRAQIENL